MARRGRTGAAAAAMVAAAALVAGCGHGDAYQVAGTSAATPAPAGAATGAPTMKQVRAQLAKLGYRLYKPEKLPSGPLRAFRGIWRSAGDGGVQNVFFFEGDRFVGVAHDPNFRSAVIAAQNGHQVTVRQYVYRADDPSCCPSGGTRDYRYTWSHGHLTVRGHGGTHRAPTTPPPSPAAV